MKYNTELNNLVLSIGFFVLILFLFLFLIFYRVV